MFVYPQQAEVNRVVAKTKIFTHAKPTKRIKALFAAQVGEIVWKYKLSTETINLPARDGIAEIQVFEIAVKGDELDEAVLQAIDKAVTSPICFRLLFAEHIQFAAAFKRPSGTGTMKWVVEARFRTGPQPVNGERPALPVALDLASLYAQMLRRHLPLPARAAESIGDHVARCQLIEAKETERQQLQVRLGKEKQFNRKVEMNATLRSLSRELKILKQL